MRLYCAPMEGLTGYIFRLAHREFFPGVDKYFTPFLSPGQNRSFTPRERADVLPERNVGIPLAPQLLTNRAEDFLRAAQELADMGYREVNLNLGCPSGTVTAKGKGSGFLAFPDALDAFLDAVCARTPLPVSVKTRIGVRDEAEWPRLLAIFRRYPLSELIVHPRLQVDRYRGPVRAAALDPALADSPFPVGYNGDLFCAADFRAFSAAHPGVDSAMLGRGLIANPALIRQIRGGPPLDKAELRAFYERLRADYLAALPGEKTILFRMKELCLYMSSPFPDAERYKKRIRKASRLADYEDAVNRLFDECELPPDARFHPIDVQS